MAQTRHLSRSREVRLLFGTRNGGDAWEPLAEHLLPILSLEAVVL